MTHKGIEEIEEHEMTPFEAQLAQAILGALEYRGFYDCGKYLDTSLIEHIRPLLTTHTEAIQREERGKRDEVYRERDMLVSALSKVFPAYLAKHDENDEKWDREWMWIVYIQIPTRTKVVSGDQHNQVPESQWFKHETKQVSWHIHESELPLFAHLETRENNWDGHTTEEKYHRMQALHPTPLSDNEKEV